AGGEDPGPHCLRDDPRRPGAAARAAEPDRARALRGEAGATGGGAGAGPAGPRLRPGRGRRAPAVAVLRAGARDQLRLVLVVAQQRREMLATVAGPSIA